MDIGDSMKKFTLTLLSAAAIWLCMASNSMAGPGVRFGLVIGGPGYYAPYPYGYYGPYYGPGYYGYYGPRFYWHGGGRFYGGHHWR
jgi:hypothetical protein